MKIDAMRGRSVTAISPWREIERILALVRPTGRDVVLVPQVENSSIGRPGHSAAYTTVSPSGAKRADHTTPCRNVRSWYRGREADGRDRVCTSNPTATARA